MSFKSFTAFNILANINLKWYSHFIEKTVQRFLTKLNLVFLYDKIIMLLGIYLNELKTYMFI